MNPPAASCKSFKRQRGKEGKWYQRRKNNYNYIEILFTVV